MVSIPKEPNKTCMRELSLVVFFISFLLELVFHLDCFTHMHVQGMFATEEFGCLRVPSSDLNIYDNREKINKSRQRIPLLHIHEISLFLVPMFCVI